MKLQDQAALGAPAFDRLDARRAEQTPQALARLVVVSLFIALWCVLWLARMPMPVPFLLVLIAEVIFFLVYWRAVFLLPNVRSVEIAHYGMLAVEIVLHTTMVYFLGGITWLGAFAYVFGLIFTNTFLDLRRGAFYTTGAALAFVALVLLDATGAIPHYPYLDQGALRYRDTRFVATTVIGGAGVFFSIYLWVNWVGHQLRVERDAAVRAQDGLLLARRELERANSDLERRVAERTAEIGRANVALRESGDLLRATIESTADGILVVNGDGGAAYTNQRFLEMWRIPEHMHDDVHSAESLQLAASQLTDPDAFMRRLEELKAKDAEDVDTLHFKDGRAFERYWRPLRRGSRSDGQVISFRDVTERRRAEEALRASEERLRTVITNAPVVLFAMDREGVLTLAEGKGLQGLDIRSSDIVGRAARDVYRGSPEILGYIRRALDGEHLTATVRLGDAWFETHCSPVLAKDGGVLGVTGVAIDITERRRAEEALRERARRDLLTGALNHASITESLADLTERLEPGASVAVVMVDIDGMKATNDSYGHQFGDQVLAFVAGTLARDGAIVGRYGGDEFLVLLPGRARGDAERYCDTIEQALAATTLADAATGSPVPVLASIGLAVYPGEAETIEDVVRLADSAMYTAKRRQIEAGLSASRSAADDRAARLVGEVVPLLTSPGDLNEKLGMVSRRLSLAAGYDGVNIEVFGPSAQLAHNAYLDGPSRFVDQWNREQVDDEGGPIRRVVAQTRRPLILDDLAADERINDRQRELLREAGIVSGLVVPMFWQGDLVGLLSVGSKRARAFGPRDAQFLTSVAAQVTAIVRLSTLADGLQVASRHLAQAQAETVMLLAAAAEAHDHTTGRHLSRVRAVSEALARVLGYDESAAAELGLAAVLHDIGKIRVPDAVLASASLLTEDEWVLMKQHTVWGAAFLAGRPGFELAATVARCHHERWDGSGYPRGLAGHEIPEAAAIVAVADAFDAMTNDRPYRVGRTPAWALREIQAGAGTQFSPRVVDALTCLHERGELPLAPPDATPERAAA